MLVALLLVVWIWKEESPTIGNMKLSQSTACAGKAVKIKENITEIRILKANVCCIWKCLGSQIK